jgi:hypothetical protein
MPSCLRQANPRSVAAIPGDPVVLRQATSEPLELRDVVLDDGESSRLAVVVVRAVLRTVVRRDSPLGARAGDALGRGLGA